ncbi:hypothetical protein SDC9_166969 [bioreactor metagenome]|uniref:Uncharacterized protein n=1 Tax=bioreactor metagenome TaxID=1076179 RepID=A0A645FYH9_9ZZZZ
MTGMPLSFACASTLTSACESIDATTRQSAPEVIMFSIWETCACTSSSAYCKSTVYPSASNWLFRLPPSWIQRCELWVGIAIPTVLPLAVAALLDAILVEAAGALEAPPAPVVEQAASDNIIAAVSASAISFFIVHLSFFSSLVKGSSFICGPTALSI